MIAMQAGPVLSGGVQAPPDKAMKIGPGHLAQRQREPEIMDDPALDPRRHRAALRGLARINRVSASVQTLWSAIRGLTGQADREPLRVLDVATGAGDIPIGLWQRARRSGISLDVDACDTSPRAVTFARQAAARLHASVSFFQLDVLRQEIPAGYDVVMASLFLHHLDEAQAGLVLRKMARAARRLVLVNDLRRDGLGWLLALAGSRLLTTSDTVRVDALRSVCAAFTLDEVRAVAADAGLHSVTVRRCWPRRLLLTWQR
jgi:SAM-dependent methyltransferase